MNNYSAPTILQDAASSDLQINWSKKVTDLQDAAPSAAPENWSKKVPNLGAAGLVEESPLTALSAWSKKVTKRRRRSEKKDREAIGMTRICAASPPKASEAPLVVIATPPKNTSRREAKVGSKERVSEDSIVGKKHTKTRKKIHAYEHTGDRGKLTSAYRVLEAAGAGYAFTLNLGPEEIAAANDNVKGFTSHFKRRITRALRRALGYDPHVGFAVDVARDDRLHIQGVLCGNDNQLEAIDRALCHAGGKWADPRHADKQCELEPLYTPDVWSNYCLRNQARVKRLISGPVISITNPLRRKAKELWWVSRVLADLIIEPDELTCSPSVGDFENIEDLLAHLELGCDDSAETVV